ncbi:hypothetical protein [Sphingomonas sp.]|jgi:hypothetical protein|uniref:hypothetical protein n=1 Tax=Sphingomonas sp. TaxID=28214 RepID=UPI002ED8B550
MGLLIGAATLWNSWSERRDAAQVREDAQRTGREAAASERRRIGLIATDEGGASLAFKGVACALQVTTITFPPALHLADRSTVTVHEMEADWLADPLLKLTDGGADTRQGRLPVLIDSDCQDERGARSERAIYDLIWRTHPRPLRGRALEIRGMVLREGGGTPARLDALWARAKP